MRFGKTLRDLREQAGLRLKDLADAMKWSVVYLSDIERGRRNPPQDPKICEIAKILRVVPDLLLDSADEERGRVELGIESASPWKQQAAFTLARSWDGMTEDQAERIINILNQRREEGEDSRCQHTA
jgi:transcriptional regulator with XRE-family HTH domain